MKRSTLDEYQVHGTRNEVIVGHSKILLWDLINKKSMDLKEATNSLKALLYDEAYPQHSLRKAELVDQAVEELSAVGLLKTIDDLKKKWTNDDGSIVTLEDYMNDMGYTSDEPSRLEARGEVCGSILPSDHFSTTLDRPLYSKGDEVVYTRHDWWRSHGEYDMIKVKCIVDNVYASGTGIRYDLSYVSGGTIYGRVNEAWLTPVH